MCSFNAALSLSGGASAPQVGDSQSLCGQHAKCFGTPACELHELGFSSGTSCQHE